MQLVKLCKKFKFKNFKLNKKYGLNYENGDF